MNRLRKKLQKSPVLISPDFKEPYIIQTDASNKGPGYVISQEVDNELRPVKFGGRILSKSKLNYDTTTKELLAIYFCVKQNEVYLMNSNFIVYCDHKPLVNLRAFKNILSKRHRWIEYLEEMNVKINYLPGFKNIVTDYLSRNLQKQDPWKPLNSFHISSITLQNDSFLSEFINRIHNDGELEPLFKAIEENHKENGYVTKALKKYLPFIFIEDNVLKIKFKNKVLLVVPKSLRYEIISLSHSEWYSGHFGIFKTIQRIYNKYWWPTVKEDVTNFISTCKICLSIKTPNRSCGKTGRRKWPTAPLELISLDF